MLVMKELIKYKHDKRYLYIKTKSKLLERLNRKVAPENTTGARASEMARRVKALPLHLIPAPTWW